MMQLFDGQHVLLVGLGESGLACARWVLSQGGGLTVVDSRQAPPGLDSLQADGKPFEFKQSVEDIGKFDRLVVSPGLAPHHPLMRSAVEKAGAAGLQPESELDLFAQALSALKDRSGYSPRVIGVTGTNGKTTTVRMVECMARYSGVSVSAAGNISPAALQALRESLATNSLPKIWVLELSSFQLHWTSQLRCDAAVVLNLTQDHLDWHADADEYRNDKIRIFSQHGTAVVNRDVSVVTPDDLPSEGGVIRFGLDKPTRSGDFGLIRDGGIQWLAQAVAVTDAVIKRGKVTEAEEVSVKLLMPAEVLKVAGLHNVSNALAALALCSAVGLKMAGLLHGLRQFEGEPHRVSFVQQIEGVDFIDDSKGTNVGATVAALNGLARPCILIAGGDGKGQDFSVLRAPVKQFCKAVVTIGKDGPTIAHALMGTTHIESAETLEQAVEHAFALGGSGDVVLLSPACASLDMFKNYAHRAKVFVDAVAELGMSRGQVC